MSDEQISDFDIAILDSIKSIIEVLASKGIASHAEFANVLSHQRDSAIKAHNGKGASVFHLLVEFCNNPQRAQTRYLSEEPPHGNA